MGLDMYLYKKTYVRNWNFQSDEEKHSVLVKKGNEIRKDIKPERIVYIEEQVGYWRKFNALHNWFTNLCDEKDGHDCNYFRVDISDLKNLLEILEKVKDSLNKSSVKKTKVHVGFQSKNGVVEKIMEDNLVFENTEFAEENFPTTSGFFFGSTEYDEYYLDQIVETINLVKEIIDEDQDAEYYYSASW